MSDTELKKPATSPASNGYVALVKGQKIISKDECEVNPGVWKRVRRDSVGAIWTDEHPHYFKPMRRSVPHNEKSSESGGDNSKI